MVQPLLAVYGFVALVVPERLVEFWESVAFENTDDAELRFGVVTLARLEGLTILASAVRDEESSTLQAVLGAFGLAALLAPRRYLDVGMKIAYRDADEISVKSWVVPLTRVFGFVFLFNALRGVKTESDSEREDVAVEA